MACPAPTYQPTFADAQVAECRALIRRQPARDNKAAGRRLDEYANWVRYWRKRWVRLARFRICWRMLWQRSGAPIGMAW